MSRVVIVGAGLAGCLLAIELSKRGFSVEIYERRADRRKVVQDAGRSINLAVSARGIHALTEAGIWQSVSAIAVPMYGRRMHSVSGELTFQPYGKDPSEHINSMSRAALNVALLDAAEAHGIPIHFEQRCIGVDLESGTLTFANATVQAETIIAADGANSAVRAGMLKLNRFNFSQQFLDYGYKELTIPAAAGGKHRMETNALHIWPRGNHMLIALPNPDGSFGCILFLPYDGPDSFASLQTPSDVRQFFESRFPDAVPLMPHLVETYLTNPAGSMVTIRCEPWSAHGRVLLLGDASHAIVPFFGQGLNAAFEDCTILLEILDRLGPQWPLVFREFERNRRQDTGAIADLALENFIEMRDRVGDPAFLFRKQAELALEARYPDRFIPKYSLVTFHRVPYSVAQSRGRIQERLLSELCNGKTHVADLDWQQADSLIARDLGPLL